MLLEQDEVLLLVPPFLVEKKLHETQVAPERIDLCDEMVGLDANPLALRQRRFAGIQWCARRRGLTLRGGGNRRLDGGGWRLPEGLPDRRCGHRLRLMSISHPGIDQQEHRDRKDQPYKKPVTIHLK